LGAIAASNVGSATKEVHGFEPVTEYFRKLKQKMDRNSEYNSEQDLQDEYDITFVKKKRLFDASVA